MLPAELIAWNSTAVAYPREKTIARLFEEQVGRTPEAVAVVSGDQRLTYRELDARANRLARYLQDSGVGPETLVGMAIERSHEMLIALLAILKAGGAYLPLDPDYPSARIALVVEDAQAPLLLTTERMRGRLPAIAARIISVDREAEAISSRSPAPVASSASGSNLAYVIYTSGSTGKPKGVMVENRNVINFFVGMDRAIGPEPGVWLAVTSISFDISVLELLWTLTRGFEVVIHGDDGVDTIPAEMVRHRVTHFQSTPSLARMLFSDPRSLTALGSLKKFFLGGEALPASLVSSLRQVVRGQIHNMYGPTETTIWSTTYEVRELRTTIPVGRPIANTQVYVLDAQRQPMAVGEAGELFIGGDGVVRGYWNRAELTSERFIPDPFRSGGRLYRTGDIARFLPDGNLDFLGRSDLQVKIRGHRIELGEIEAVLEQQPAVRQAVVVADEDPLGGKTLAAYVVAKAGESVTATGLRSALGAKLPEYMVPSHFVFLESFPLTANGKIDRNALPGFSVQLASAKSAEEAPRGEIEQTLAQIWAEVLGVERVGRNDNFFDLGGHSLSAFQIALKVQQAWNMDFPLNTFLDAPVLAAQAQRLEEKLLAGADQSELERLVEEIEQMPEKGTQLSPKAV